MKHLFIILFLLTALIRSHAQSLKEWTQQKETQKKYLVEQIAALKVYNEYVQKGFTIAKEGLMLISDIKRGDFKLHEGYFNSLKIVNPQIKKDTRVAAIIALQLQMLKAFKKTYQQLKQGKQINSEEVNYSYTVGTNLIDGCIANLNELFQIITDGNLQMKDDKRLKGIEALYKDIQDKNAFLQSFNNQFKVLALQRTKEAKDIQISKSIYGIK